MERTDFYWVEANRDGLIPDDPDVSESLLSKEKFARRWEQYQTFLPRTPAQQIVQCCLSGSFTSQCLISGKTESTQYTSAFDSVERVIFLHWSRPSNTQSYNDESKQWLVNNDSIWVKHRREALQMLQDIELYLEDGDQRPTVELKKNVEHLVDGLFDELDLPVHIDGTPEGDILVTVFNEKRETMMIYCDARGVAQCRTTLCGKREKRDFESIHSVTDAPFVREALRLLSSQTDQQSTE